jgi:hypothetical protein
MDRLYLFVVTTPAGTSQAAPLTTDLPLEDSLLKELRIIVPAGHSGLTGVRLLQAHQQIIPWDNNSYIVGNDRVIDVPFDNEMTVSGLQAVTYNTDIFDHSHHIEVVITDLELPGRSVNAAQGGTAIVTDTAPSQLDPLSPDALIASVPPEVLLPLPDSLAEPVT